MNAPGIPPRLSRVSWNLSGGPPPEACHGVGVGRRQDTNQEGDHRDQQVPEITCPRRVPGQGSPYPAPWTISMSEIAEDMREGLLALAVGAGLQVMACLMEADVAAVCGPVLDFFTKPIPLTRSVGQDGA